LLKKILIVEDNEDNLDLMVQLLEDCYALQIAADGIQALERVRREQPDLILMDMALPLLNGWDATRQIKSDPATQHIPVIGVSSHAMPEDEERARLAGCDEYLTKPLDEINLFHLIEKYLGSS
jgi:two-component system, cell cycle response regulator DivK